MNDEANDNIETNDTNETSVESAPAPPLTASSPVAELAALPGGALVLAFLFFLLSGASGLIYEVIWTRALLTVFGATLYAVATVLAAFMGGLALGSFVGGRFADRLRSPLRAYAALEIAIALTALAVPFTLRLFDPLYRAVYASGEANFTTLSLIRFFLSFIVLLIPTTCMGATLPILSRFLARRADAIGGRIGGLYAVNTLGAVIGAFLAGFVLIGRFGVQGSLFLAAGISILVGVGAFLLSIAIEKKTDPDAPAPTIEPSKEKTETDLDSEGETPLWMARLVLGAYAVSGFLALAFQVFWTRALVFRFDYLKNTTYAFSAMLTVFLAGLAGGSLLMAARVNRQRSPVRLYGLLQILTGLSGAFSLFMLIRYVDLLPLPEAGDLETGIVDWNLAVLGVFLKTAAAIGLPTFLMGMAFPVAARICVRRLQTVGSGAGRLYALNTIGAIFGSFAAGFVLIPLFGLARGFLLLGLAYTALGTVILLLNPFDTREHKIAWAVGGAIIFAIFFSKLPNDYYFQGLEPGHQLVTLDAKTKKKAYIEGPLATVSVVENTIGDRTVYVDGSSVAGTDQILLTDQKSLAHMPALLLENPKSALTVGFGSGGASWSYLLYKELERVDCVEICQTVPRLASTLRVSNHGVLDEWDGIEPLHGRKFHNGRYQIIIDDVRSYLRFTEAKYDIISTDCTDLRYKSNANLYDLEYFKLCRQAVTDDGMVVVWMPLGGMTSEVFACALNTFAEVFPGMTLWYMNNQPTHYMLLIGTPSGDLKINIARLVERIARPEIKKDLEEIHLDRPEKILSCYLGDFGLHQSEFKAMASALNTENHPIIEFESPRYGYGDDAMLDNLELLRKKRVSVRSLLEDADKHPKFVESLGRFEAAIEPILSGHAAYRRMHIEESCRYYLAAAAVCPEDESVAFLLEYDELERISQLKLTSVTQSLNQLTIWGKVLWAETVKGELALVKNEIEKAVDSFNAVLDKTNFPTENPDVIDLRMRAILGIAGCYESRGSYRKGINYLDEHTSFYGKDPKFQKLRKTLEEKDKAEKAKVK